jgi:hypothetical protein
MPDLDIRGLVAAATCVDRSGTATLASALDPLNKTSLPLGIFLLKVNSPAIFI